MQIIKTSVPTKKVKIRDSKHRDVWWTWKAWCQLCASELIWIGVINKDSNDLPCKPNILPRISTKMNFSIRSIFPGTKLSFPGLWFSHRSRNMVGARGGSRGGGVLQFTMTACQSHTIFQLLSSIGLFSPDTE